MSMQNTNLQTYNVPAVGTVNPATLAKAAKVPCRVVISNVGPVVLFVSDATADLMPVPSTAVYRIFPGEAPSLVLAPKQSFYAVGAAAGGLASVAISDALPLT